MAPYDQIRMELEGREEFGGTHDSLQVIAKEETEIVVLWQTNLSLELLEDFIGKTEKTKVVVKLQKNGSGPTARESVMMEEDRKLMMMLDYRKQVREDEGVRGG
ncbi:unnamed protein product [Orchesella dallaii]|uniref:Uncharacterized protein n=1 Tax=Orchesella dallaii TaxID=48710 RepID=A0ABP1RT83_9HEXA